MAHNALSLTQLKIETKAVASSCVGMVQPGLDFKYVTAAIDFQCVSSVVLFKYRFYPPSSSSVVFLSSGWPVISL
jgi:hypothetical protein